MAQRGWIISGLLAVLLLSATVALAEPGPLDGVLVCLDPGHGGSDPGAVNAEYNLYESHINLDVAYGLARLLRADGARVELTRTDDSYYDNSDRYTFCNALSATLIVSVHTNSVTDPTWDGIMTLYKKDVDLPLAETLHAVMRPLLRDTAPDPAVFRDFGLDHFASGVLLKSDMPAAMIEPLLMSNPAEAALLVQPLMANGPAGQVDPLCAEYQCRRGQIASAVHAGLLEYIAAVAPTPGALHVAAVDMWADTKPGSSLVYTRVTVHDAAGIGVPEALVSLQIAQPDNRLATLSGLTGVDGTVTLKLRARAAGRYLSTVTGVSRPGWTYDPADNLVSGATLLLP